MLSIRKIGALGRTYRHLHRYRQILGVFFKYGFDDLIARLKIDQYIEVGLQMISRRPGTVQKHTRAERIRMAMEELGPTYVKLGQLLSTRTDLIPIHFIEEFSKLQEHVPPFSFREVKILLEKELRQPMDFVFSFFDEAPFASASIGQVHLAHDLEGERLAVKVQRPGIQRVIEADLEIMLHLAMLMERNVEEVALHRPVAIVEEFARALEKELDYSHEAANMERFARQFFGDPTVCIPKVYNDLSTDRVLTMEYIEGIRVTDFQRLEQESANKQLIVERGADLFLRQIFDHRFFHADPHPGNIRVMADNVICLLDFGMMGSVDRLNKQEFVELIYGVVRQDEVRTTQVLLRLTQWEEEPEPRLLERDVSDLMGQYLHRPLKKIEIGKLLQQLLELSARYHMRIPPDIFLMLKSLSTIEGIARMLHPDFDLVAQIAPFIQREKMARYQPRRLAEDLITLSSEIFHFANQFPQDVLEVTRLIKRQRFSIRFEHHGLENMIETHDRISNKLSFSIIIAALIIGSSIIIIAEIPPLFYGISFIGIIIFIAAVIMGVWLLMAIIRRGRY